MLAYICGLLIIVAIYLIYKWVIYPRKELARYAKLFKAHGYKVIEMPFKPYSAPFFIQFVEDKDKHNDPIYTHRHIYPTNDIILSNLLTKPEIIIINAQMIREVMSPQKIMILPKELKITEVFFMLLKKGIISIQGDEWKHRRKLLSQVFTYDFITALIPQMIKIADQSFEHFQQKNKITTEEQSQLFKGDLFDMMVKFTSSVIVGGFLGFDALNEQLKGESIVDAVLKLMAMGVDGLSDPLLLMFGKKLLNRRWRKFDRQYMRLMEDVDNVLLSFVMNKSREEEIGSEKGHKTIVELLLSERKKEGNIYISDDEIVDQIKTFVVAGSDTTSNTLTAMLLHVFQKPEVLTKLTKQINAVIKSDADINVDNFKKLNYLECVINETSRLFSTLNGLAHRQVIEDTTIGGVPFKKGTLISASWVSLFHSPELFQDPLEFRPQRWEQQQCKKHLNIVSMLFSGGPRGCLGKSLALVEIKVMMIKFLQRYDKLKQLALKDGKRAYDIRFLYVVKDSSVELGKIQ